MIANDFAADEDYTYEEEGVEDADVSDDAAYFNETPIDIARLSIAAPNISPLNQAFDNTRDSCPSVSEACEGDRFAESPTENELTIEEMTAKIDTVSSVLCCHQEDAALFLKVVTCDNLISNQPQLFKFPSVYSLHKEIRLVRSQCNSWVS